MPDAIAPDTGDAAKMLLALAVLAAIAAVVYLIGGCV
jgi:hypothetical protein